MQITEISTTISYQENKRSEKFTTSGSGDYCVPKLENTQYKVENGIQSKSNFTSLKVLVVASIDCKAFRYTAEKKGADKFNVDNTLVCEFHFNPSDINIPLEKAKGLWNILLFQVFMKLTEGSMRAKE